MTSVITVSNYKII